MYNNINPAPGGGAENWRERESLDFILSVGRLWQAIRMATKRYIDWLGRCEKKWRYMIKKGRTKGRRCVRKESKNARTCMTRRRSEKRWKKKKREFEWWWIERVIQPIGRAACDRDEDGPTNQCCNCAYNVFWYIPHLVSCCRGTSASITFFKCNAYTYGIRANGTMTGTNRPLVLTRHFSQLSALLLLLLLSPFRSWRWADPLAHYQRIGWRNDSPGN